jgi:hypothetical protein
VPKSVVVVVDSALLQLVEQRLQTRQPIESSDKRGDRGFDPLAQKLLFERRSDNVKYSKYVVLVDVRCNAGAIVFGPLSVALPVMGYAASGR